MVHALLWSRRHRYSGRGSAASACVSVRRKASAPSSGWPPPRRRRRHTVAEAAAGASAAAAGASAAAAGVSAASAAAPSSTASCASAALRKRDPSEVINSVARRQQRYVLRVHRAMARGIAPGVGAELHDKWRRIDPICAA